MSNNPYLLNEANQMKSNYHIDRKVKGRLVGSIENNELKKYQEAATPSDISQLSKSPTGKLVNGG